MVGSNRLITNQRIRKREQGAEGTSASISRQNARVFNLIRLMLHKRPALQASLSPAPPVYISFDPAPFPYILVGIKTTFLITLR